MIRKIILGILVIILIILNPLLWLSLSTFALVYERIFIDFEINYIFVGMEMSLGIISLILGIFVSVWIFRNVGNYERIGK